MSNPTRKQVASEVLAWFEATWNPDLPLLEWREVLVASGWAVPSWPTQWHGRGLPVWADRLAHDTIRKAGGVTTPLGSGMSLAAPTIVEHGSDDVKQRLLRPTLTGEISWCQLFSEPGAGSDLAGLRCSAVRDGDDWIVSGQKVWNTSAHHADMGMLLARTDPTVPKHAGITYFALPMDQEGIEVRPIEQMNYYDSFTEVFLTECRIPADNVIGDVGDGWRVARATLMHERTFATMGKVRYPKGVLGRTVSEAKAESDDYLKTYVWYPQRAGRADLLLERARSKGLSGDPVVRQALADMLSFQRAQEWTAARAKAARQLGRAPGPEGSLGKLGASELARRSARTHSLISGASAMLGEGPEPNDAIIAEVLLSTPAQSIAGGTDEIQRNIIAEKILGLPREPS
ncbi:MAG: acyl-CoA dehydrogenase family protein [Acidimicrobiales bacterium]